MAISYVKLVSSAEPHSPGTTYALAVTNAPGAGNLLVMANGGGAASILTSVTDSKGNTWTVDKTAANVNSSGNYTTISSTVQDVGTLTTSDTITLHFTSNDTGYVPILLHEFSGATHTVDQTANFGTATASTARDGGTTAATTNANDLVVAAFSVLGNETSFTAGTGYTAPASGAFIGNTSASVEFEYKIVNATGTQHPTGTGAKSLANGGATVVYKAAAGVTNSDSGSGTITLSGSRTESQTVTTSGTGTISLTGSRTESAAHTAAATGTIVLSGSATAAQTGTDAGTGTIRLGGAGTDQYGVIYNDSGAGTVTLTGSATDAQSVLAAGLGILVLSGSATEAFVHGGVSLAPFLLHKHTGLARLNNIEQWLKDNTSFLGESGTHTNRQKSVEDWLTANPLNGITYVPYYHAGTDWYWAIEEYLLAVTGSGG